jgi:hypothetical protein
MTIDEQELALLTNELERQESGICMEDIRPAMSEEERHRTLEQILHVLRGEL